MAQMAGWTAAFKATAGASTTCQGRSRVRLVSHTVRFLVKLSGEHGQLCARHQFE